MGMKNGRVWSSKTLKYLKRKKRLPKWAMKNFLESNYKTEKKKKKELEQFSGIILTLKTPSGAALLEIREIPKL